MILCVCVCVLQVFLSPWNANARPVFSQHYPVLVREGRPFVLPYYYPALYLPAQSYPYYGVDHAPYQRQPEYNSFPSLPSEQSLLTSEIINQSSGRSMKKHQVAYDDEEALELASSLVDDYLNLKLNGTDLLNTAIEEDLRDFSSNVNVWENGKINI